MKKLEKFISAISFKFSYLCQNRLPQNTFNSFPKLKLNQQNPRRKILDEKVMQSRHESCYTRPIGCQLAGPRVLLISPLGLKMYFS